MRNRNGSRRLRITDYSLRPPLSLRRRPMARRAACTRVFLLCLFALGVPAAPASAGELPQGATALVARAGELLQQNDTAGLAQLAGRPEAFSWLRGGRRASGWSVAPLMIPGREGGEDSPAAVFYAFHICE